MSLFFFSKSVDQILEIIYHFTQIFTPLITMVFNTKKEKKNYFTHVRILKRKHCCSNRGPKDCLNTFYWMYMSQKSSFLVEMRSFCLEKGEHCIPAKEPYPICETWWWEYCSLGMFWCIWSRAACH